MARRYIAASPIGAVTLDRLQPSHVGRLLIWVRESGCLDSTTRQTYTVPRAIVESAIRDGLLAADVVAKVPRPTVRNAAEPRALTADEVAAQFDALGNSRYARMLRFMLATGLRRGEALALHRDAGDLDARRFRVPATLRRVHGELRVSEPTTKRTRRPLPLSNVAADLLAEQKRRNAAEAARMGVPWRERRLVFPSEVAGYMDPRNALRAVQSAARRANVPDVNPHTLRHTPATSMLLAGVPLLVVSELLGHVSVAITADVYGHFPEAAPSNAVDVLAEFLGVAFRRADRRSGAPPLKRTA